MLSRALEGGLTGVTHLPNCVSAIESNTGLGERLFEKRAGLSWVGSRWTGLGERRRQVGLLKYPKNSGLVERLVLLLTGPLDRWSMGLDPLLIKLELSNLLLLWLLLLLLG